MSMPPSLKMRADAFAELGNIMGWTADSYTTNESSFKDSYPVLSEAMQSAVHHNPWFTDKNIALALNTWKEVLSPEAIHDWISIYETKIQNVEVKRVAVVMAGNIPLVGFHDFICTLMAGHFFIGKLSSDDKILLPALADVLCTIEPSFSQMIEFTENTLHDFDAIIATGSNNTARYFEYYFSKYPHVIRKNRNGIAILTGNETDEELEKLGGDICNYFGLGCRNVSKVFIPDGYDPGKLFTAFNPFIKALSDHFKFMNNHSYHSSVYLLNSTPFLDNGVFLLTESERYSSPIAVVYYQFYSSMQTLEEKLAMDDDLIQCIASQSFNSSKTVPLGFTQSPGLVEYADGIDTMKFLLDL